MSKIDQLRSELQHQIERLDKESKKHKRLYRQLRYSVFILAAASTVLASTALTFPDFQALLNLIIVFITAIVGVITSIEGLRKPAELWIHERNIYYALKDLLREVEYYSFEEPSCKITDKYFSRMQTILGSSIEEWKQQVQTDKTPEPKKEPEENINNEEKP
ncbi:MAG: DUF4231 domain-containing protein [bacterium]